jgi:hypothetical protein
VKKKILFSLLLLSLVTLFTMTSSASATDYTKVGVRVGDTAVYTCTTPTGTTRFRIEILQIAGTNVTISERELYPNNTEGPAHSSTGDISTVNNPIQEYLVPAGLSQGDNIIADWWHID